MKRLLSSLLALTLLLVGVSAAYADAESTDPVLARVGEDTITLSQAQEIYDEIIAYYHDNDNGYDFENEDFLAGIRENAMAQLLEERFIFQTAKANGLDQITEEDEAQLIEDNNLMWENAIADYISYFSSDAEPSEDDLATMCLNAVAYFGAQGYTVESTLETSRNRLIYNRLMDKLTEGFTVSDEDVDLTYHAAAQQ